MRFKHHDGTPYSVEEARSEIVAQTIEAAYMEHHKDVVDSRKSPESIARIRKYIHGDDGARWKSCPKTKKQYERNGDFQWCGVFAGYCLGRAGLAWPFRKYDMPSCYRLDRAFRYKGRTIDKGFRVRVPPAAGSKNAMLRPFAGNEYGIEDFHEEVGDMRRWGAGMRELEPEPGDILIVGDGKPAYGDHVAIVRFTTPPNEVQTYEGNAKTYGTKGDLREGVGTQTRRLSGSYRILRVYRWSVADFFDEVEYVRS